MKLSVKPTEALVVMWVLALAAVVIAFGRGIFATNDGLVEWSYYAFGAFAVVVMLAAIRRTTSERSAEDP